MSVALMFWPFFALGKIHTILLKSQTQY